MHERMMLKIHTFLSLSCEKLQQRSHSDAHAPHTVCFEQKGGGKEGRESQA